METRFEITLPLNLKRSMTCLMRFESVCQRLHTFILFSVKSWNFQTKRLLYTTRTTMRRELLSGNILSNYMNILNWLFCFSFIMWLSFQCIFYLTLIKYTDRFTKLSPNLKAINYEMCSTCYETLWNTKYCITYIYFLQQMIDLRSMAW